MKIRLYNSIVLIFFLFLFSSCNDNNDISPFHKLYSLTVANDSCVYSTNNHAAFTSLIKFKGELYLAFREGPGHVPANKNEYGKIKIHKKVGNHWDYVCTLFNSEMDLRDPFFVIVGDSLKLYCGFNQFDSGDADYQQGGTAYAIFTEKGWSNFEIVKNDSPHVVWIWKLREFKNHYYGIGYNELHKPILFSSIDGNNWKTVSELDVEGIMSEADLNFIGDSLYVCFRNDTRTGSPSYWGKSIYPFSQFDWRIMDKSIACPEIFCHPESHQMWIAGREYITDESGKVSKVIISCNEVSANGDITNPLIIHEGEGWDMGYPSFLYEENKLMLSYYYLIEKGTCVNVSSIVFNPF